MDSRHHLMSIVSRIDPSPDWIVGVSSLELCLKNCSWIESKLLNLYPWDVGTDDGITYMVHEIIFLFHFKYDFFLVSKPTVFSKTSNKKTEDEYPK